MSAGRLLESRASQSRWLGVSVVASVILTMLVLAPEALAVEMYKAPRHGSAFAQVRWGCLIGLGAEVVILLIGWVVGAKPWKVFIGADNHISTSKTIAAIWTLVVAATLIGMVYANVLDHPDALKATDAAGVVGQYAVLFGGPLGAAILAKQIVNVQLASGVTVNTPGSPSPKDLIANNAGDTDLGDLQYVLFNGVALFFVISTFLHAPLEGLPHIPDVLLGLTSVSAVGYVGKKALGPSGISSGTLDSTTTQGGPGAPVKIVITGLAASMQRVQAWVRFGTSVGEVVEEPVTSGRATLTPAAPDLHVAAHQSVDVLVVLEDGTVLSPDRA